MKIKDLIIIAVPATIVVGVLAYALTRKKAYYKIDATEGGTVNPTPGDYEAEIGSQITVTALPNQDWFFNGWIINGTSQGIDNPITVNVVGYHTILATFTQTPGGGQIPVSIAAINAPINVTQYYAAGWEWWAPTSNHGFLAPVSSKKYPPEYNAYAYSKLVFKVMDAAGKGVPNVSVEVWTNDVPDVNGGYINLGGETHTSTKPLVAKTNLEGEAEILVGYLPSEIPNDLSFQNLSCTVYYYAYGNTEPFWHCKQVALPLYVDKKIWGEGEGPAIPNYVYAKVKGTILQALGAVACQIGVQGNTPL